MKTIKIFALIGSLLWANSCRDFEEFQTDPNRTTQTHPSLILTNIELNNFNTIEVSNALASRMMVFTDASDDNQYYTWQRAGFDRYNDLRQVVKMVQEAERVDAPNYKALALFFQSVIILDITRVFGDVPYSESLAGTSLKPAYDSQEQIYLKVLNDLKEANSSLTEANGEITGDLIYNGEIDLWKRLINSFSLRVLISLSNHEGNTNLDVVDRFNEIVSDPATYPIMTGNEHNAALNFYDQSTATSLQGNRYPYFNSNSFKTAYYMDKSFVDLLAGFQDPRLFTMADKTPVGSGLPDNDFSAYGGMDGSAPLAENIELLVAGQASKVDARYYSNPTNEPSLFLSYAEVEFTLAEAAERGWITSDVEDHYLAGIEASMNFYGLTSGTYIGNAGVAFDAGNALEQIITQKYINYFLQGGWEAFFNNLRTGFPEFKIDGGGVVNSQVPKRWMYPNEEFTLNLESVQAAVARQFPGGDEINEVMWLLKTE